MYRKLIEEVKDRMGPMYIKNLEELAAVEEEYDKCHDMKFDDVINSLTFKPEDDAYYRAYMGGYILRAWQLQKLESDSKINKSWIKLELVDNQLRCDVSGNDSDLMNMTLNFLDKFLKTIEMSRDIFCDVFKGMDEC
jgi:hypothetical protein